MKSAVMLSSLYKIVYFVMNGQGHKWYLDMSKNHIQIEGSLEQLHSLVL